MGQSRQSEHEQFLAWLLDLICTQKIDALIVSGDIFDTATPPNYALQIYYDFLKELSTIKSLSATIITAGNHDSIATLKAPKQLLQALNIDVIASGDSDEDVVIPIKKQDRVQAIVCAVPFLREGVIRRSFAAKTGTQKQKLANEGIKAYYEKVHQQAKALQKKLGDSIPIIATGHLTTIGSSTSDSEQDIYIGGTLDIGGDYLAKLFDYVALGHLHTNQKVGHDHVRYSGSVLPLSFSEANRGKKVNIVQFDAKDAQVQTLDIPQFRKLIKITGDNVAVQNALEKIEDKRAWIEVDLQDSNPYIANQEIRQKADDLGLTLLAVKVAKTLKQLRKKELQAVSLQQYSATDLFQKRLELEELEDEKLKERLLQSFKKVATKVQNR